MTTSIDIQNVAIKYLPWMVIAPLVGGASWMLDGIFIGATRTADMRKYDVDFFCILYPKFDYIITKIMEIMAYG